MNFKGNWMEEYGLKPTFRKYGENRVDPRKTLYMTQTGYEPQCTIDGVLNIDGDRCVIITFENRKQLKDYQDFERSLNDIEYQGAIWNINNSRKYRCFKMKNLDRCKERMLKDINMFGSIFDVDKRVILTRKAH